MSNSLKTILIDLIRQKADPKSKAWWENYVKESAPFLGVKMADIRTLVHEWHSEHIAAALTDEQQVELALDLFSGEYTEEKLAGILFLQEILLPNGALAPKRDIPRFAKLFTQGYIYDWNVCDWFCIKALGPLIEKEGMACAQAIGAWRVADNLWQARASVVAFVPVVENAQYHGLIEDGATTLIQREERFAKTAVGWILRDMSKYDTAFVNRFVTQHIAYFSTESLNNATKYYSKDDKQKYRQKLKAA